MEEFKRIKRELVVNGVLFDYYQDTMQIPNGNIAKWDLIDHKGAAAVVAVREDGKLIMVRQYRNALERETLEIPQADETTGKSHRGCGETRTGGRNRIYLRKNWNF